MGEEEASLPKLKVLPLVERSSSAAADCDPPFQASASVPFKWEEQPGKPRPCSDIITRPAKSLELPPCMNHQFTKTPSPTTVFDGPYTTVARPKFSSFRFFRDAHESNFRIAASPDGEALLGGGGSKQRGFFGKLKGGTDGGGSCRFSPSTSVSSCESEETFAGVKSNVCGVKMRRNGSFSTISHAKSSHLWTSIYQGIKQAMHWKSSKKSNKQGRD